MSTFSRLQKGVDCCDVYVQLYDIVFALTKNCMFRLNGGVVLKRFFFCKDFFFFQNQETIANADKGSKQKRCRKLERKKTRQVEKKNNWATLMFADLRCELRDHSQNAALFDSRFAYAVFVFFWLGKKNAQNWKLFWRFKVLVFTAVILATFLFVAKDWNNSSGNTPPFAFFEVFFGQSKQEGMFFKTKLSKKPKPWMDFPILYTVFRFISVATNSFFFFDNQNNFFFSVTDVASGSKILLHRICVQMHRLRRGPNVFSTWGSWNEWRQFCRSRKKRE